MRLFLTLRGVYGCQKTLSAAVLAPADRKRLDFSSKPHSIVPESVQRRAARTVLHVTVPEKYNVSPLRKRTHEYESSGVDDYRTTGSSPLGSTACINFSTYYTTLSRSHDVINSLEVGIHTSV